jgi:hypothetical protein
MKNNMNTIHELIKSYTNQIEDYEKLINKLTLENEKFKRILDATLFELPVGHIPSHTYDSIPERVEYYVKEFATLAHKDEKPLYPKQPICTKCKHNLHYYDGWHCVCELNDLDKDNWINFQYPDNKMLQEEVSELRKVISSISTNLGNGSVVSEEASLEFIQMLPDEVKLVVDGNKRQLNPTQIAFRELFQGLKKLVESFEKYLN